MDDTVAMGDSSPAEATDILTPRSKVAKMLADIDEEIDNAPTPSPTNRHSEPLANSVPVIAAINTSPTSAVSDRNLANTVSTASKRATESSDSDESDDGIRRPHGRAARRMLGKVESSTTPTISPARFNSEPRAASTDAESDEENLYSATPRKPQAHTQTASSSPTGDDRGNGLFVSPNKTVNSPTGGEKGNGLFVSPAKTVDSDGEEELPSNPFGSNKKLAQLIAQKRAERLAKESEERQRKKKSSAANTSSDLPEEAFENSQEPVDPNIEKIMSDASRPARKASKKALLDMERETQRLAREQALAHQMKVKKKFTTNDLFAKFNFRQPSVSNKVSNEQQQAEGDSSASSVPNSDGIEEKTRDSANTPPSSPPTPLDRQKALVDVGALDKLVPVREDTLVSLAEIDGDEELPDLADVLRSSQKAKALPAGLKMQDEQPAKKGLKLARLGKKAVAHHDSSDDELDIVPSLPPHLRAFEKVSNSKRAGGPADSKAIHNLRHLAHMHADDTPQHKKGSKPSINAKALENQLRRQAKEQARKQQLERIEELRAKGIEVQTTEEREKEAEVLENLLEKARQDAVELRKAEKAARKGVDGEPAMEVSDDEDEDEDYSDSEEESGDGEDEDGDKEENGDGLLDDAAEEASDEEEDSEDNDDVLEAEDEVEPLEEEVGPVDAAVAPVTNTTGEERHLSTPAIGTRKPRKSRIIMDEDDEADSEPDDEIEQVAAEDDPFAAFGFGAGGNANALLSPTQAFHATMETPTQATQDDNSFDMLRHLAPPSAFSVAPSVPDMDTQFEDEEENEPAFVAGSQVPESQRIHLNWETQPPETPVSANLHRDVSALSETPEWQPTQDQGLASPWSVKLRRESTLESLEEHETQSTVRMRISESPAASQTMPKRGRLVRRKAVVEDESDEDEAVSSQPKKKDAFKELARRRKEALTAGERAEADKEMRQMMDEQAEESEDEYAGLGGDDFVAPETEQDKEMIDSSYIDVDERELAAHYAERERIRNEAETSRLYKDLTTGVLRRKMGANAFDLEEDEDELAARRRQMRQQEEARKRKALLKDINIATLADGKPSKGKDAFLKAIADDDDGDEDPANLSGGDEDSVPATQDSLQASQSQQQVEGALLETNGNKRRLANGEDDAEGRPPAKQRRTQTSELRRPTSLLEVKESVSFLLDEPNATVAFAQTMLELSDSENEEHAPDQMDESEQDEFIAAEEARENNGGFAPNPKSMDAKIMPPPRLPASQRRVAPKPAVVDRLSLKRVSSASDSAHGRTAWAAGPATGGFKVPSLLRRATTNITSGANDRGVTTGSLSRENSAGVKMGGTKKSSLAYQARAEERRAIVEASAKRREENTKKIALLRRNSSQLNRGLTGRFE